MAFARAVLASPRVLPMDEPFSALDDAAKGGLLGMVEDLPRGGVTVLYVSHSPAGIARMAQRSVSIVAGRAVTAGETAAPSFKRR